MSKFKVFVSSTWEDLQPERDAVETALRRVQAVGYVGMETFGSRTETSKETCLAEVANCDIYLGLFAFRFGSIDFETGMSMTELEYHEARARNKPCLIYFKSENALIHASDFDQSPGAQGKLRAFKDDLRKNHMMSCFLSADELKMKVIHDLSRLMSTLLPQKILPPHSELEQFAQWLRDWLVVTKYQIRDSLLALLMLLSSLSLLQSHASSSECWF